MGKRKVKYIGFYGSDYNSDENRNSFLAATNKMDYIANVIAELGMEVEIISPSWTKNSKGVYPGRNIKISDKISFTCGPTFGAKNKITKIFRILFSWVWLFLYVMKNSSNDDVFFVYHSLMLILPVKFIRIFKKNELIIEVEEVYQDVIKVSDFVKKQEYKYFEIADKYVFPTELLNKKINSENKPHTLIYGTYQVEEDRGNKFNDGKIHVVYAGTFDPSKGGTLAAATAAYLSQNYHVHIIGFGSNEDKRRLLQKIEEVSKNAEATVSFDGLFTGEDYIRFLQKCDIGLSTQIPEAAYNGTSFPSKILSYMANGLRVVSIRIRSIEISEIGHVVYYYEEPDPAVIADTITSIDLRKSYDGREIIERLNLKFIENIKMILEV